MALVPIDWNPDRVRLTQFSEAGLFFVGMVAAPLAYFRGQPVFAAVLWGLAVLLRLVGLVAPGRLRLVYLGLTLATWPIGWLVSHLALALIYYGAITPITAVFRLVGREPLALRFDRTSTTYWEPYNPDRGIEQYLRQY